MPDSTSKGKRHLWSKKMMYSRLLTLSFLLMSFLYSESVYAQYGRHLSVNLGLESNGWSLDNSPKVSTSVSFLDIQYLQYNESGRTLLDVTASGFFSTLQKNNYTLSDDDLSQITNSNVFSVKLVHFFGDNDNRLGFLWGLDVLSKYLTTGAEEGAIKSPEDAGGTVLGEIVGLGVTLGAGYEMSFLYEKLIVDSQAGLFLVYNSEAANRNSTTFQATGFTGKVRGRYYLSNLFFAQAQLFYETMGHQPVNANVSDIEGKNQAFRMMFGGGVRF